jgi:hypothetical protein
MEVESILKIFRSINRNKRREDLEPDEKQERHEQLVEKFHEGVIMLEKRFANRAFEGFEYVPTSETMLEAREAIRDHEIVNLKQAALAAYHQREFTALKLAGQYDDEIGDLVDFLETYGDMASQTKRVFLAMALADPLG